MNAQALDESKNNYIMCIVCTADKYGISIADISTGDYLVTEVENQRKLLDEITKFTPTEIICNQSFLVSGVDTEDLNSGSEPAFMVWKTGILMTISANGR